MSKKILTALGYIAVLLLLAGVIAFIAVFTRGFTSEFATFYVVHASENIFAESDTKTLTADTELRFDVKYTFGDLTLNIRSAIWQMRRAAISRLQSCRILRTIRILRIC